MTDDDAKKKYDNIVNENIGELEKDPKIEIKDPDKYSNYDVEVNGLKVSLSQDGLCGIEKIRDFSLEEDIKNNYKLIRENMFDCLVWPAYAMSINQMRSVKYRDRLDLLFIDLDKFYSIVSEDTEIREEIISKIWESCDLARAYVYPNTFYWLRSFKDFDNFVNKRKLGPFIERQNGKPVIWKNSGDGFRKEYFDRLIEKAKDYKQAIADIAIAEDNSCM